MRVIIAAAGTGGHVNPGIAIANIIKDKEPNSEILFIGTRRGIENDLVPRAGYKLEHIEAYGLTKNIIKDIKTCFGFFQAKKIINRFKPDIVIGAGGYICGPVILAAHTKKIPTVLHESNAFPGKAVKMLAKYTDKIMISFEDARRQIKKSNRIVLTGTPIKINKEEISPARRIDIFREHNLKSDKPLILIFGGSQGAKKINDAVIEILSKNKKLEYQIILSAGSKQYDYVMAELGKRYIDLSDNIRIYPYIYNLDELEKISDIIVCRSGANTIAEIAMIGKPAIFVPLPNVSNNHQTFNAKTLEEVGSAEIIKNEELNGEILNKSILLLLSDKTNLRRMGEMAKTIAISDTDNRIYKHIKELIK